MLKSAGFDEKKKKKKKEELHFIVHTAKKFKS